MAELSWDEPGTKHYETDIDHGVLYPSQGAGVPWNGLISVEESPNVTEEKALYMDGIKYANLTSLVDYEATITSFYPPKEFSPCEGIAEVHSGFYVTQQPRTTFGFSFRTLIGNEFEATSFGHKLHLIYNALASSTSTQYSTVNEKDDVVQKKWKINTANPHVTSRIPTANIVLDSRIISKEAMSAIENILYGSAVDDPRLPSIDEVVMTINNHPMEE